MRAAVLAVILLSTPAYAFDARSVVEKLWEAEFQCTDGEDHDGTPVSEKVSKESCKEALKLAYELSAAGYCYINREWKPCE